MAIAIAEMTTDFRLENDNDVLVAADYVQENGHDDEARHMRRCAKAEAYDHKCRHDAHVERNLNPADYSYVGPIYLGMNPRVRARMESMPEYQIAQNALTAHGWRHGHFHHEGRCDHCGVHFIYGSVVRHKTTGDVIVIGHQCATNRFNLDSRAKWVITRAQKYANQELRLIRQEKKRDEWLAEHPTLANVISPDAPEPTDPMLRKFWDVLKVRPLTKKRTAKAYEIIGRMASVA